MTNHAECVELIRNGLEVVTKLAHTIKDDLFPGEECDEANTWRLYANRYLESHSDDTIHLSDEGAKALREVGQEQASEPPQWHEEAHIPEGEVSTGIDDYSLPAQQEEGQ